MYTSNRIGKERNSRGVQGFVVAALAAASSGSVLAADEPPIKEVVISAKQFRDDATSDVTGFDLPVVETPQSISILSRELMESTGATSIIKAADYLAGLNVVDPAGGVDTDYRARGFLISSANGFKQNGFPFSNNYFPDTAAVERIEFIKGVNSVRYGENQPGGFVNFVFKKPQKERFALFRLTGGSYDFRRLDFDTTGPITSSENTRFRLVATFEKDDTYVEHVESDTTVLAPSLAIDISDGWQQELFGYYQEFNTVPEAGVSIDNNGNIPEFRRSLFTGQPWDNVENKNLTLQSITRYTGREHMTAELGVYYSSNDQTRHYARPRNGMFTQATLLQRAPGGTQTPVFTDPAGRAYIEVPAGTAVDYDIRTPAVAESSGYGAVLRSIWDLEALNRKHTITGALEYKHNKGGIGYTYNGSRRSIRTFDIYNPDYTIPVNQTTLVPDVTSESVNYAASVMGLVRPVNRLSVLAGVRYDDTEDRQFATNGTTTTLPSKETTFSFGMTYELMKHLNVYATWGESFSPNPGVCDVNGGLLPPTSGEMYEVGAKSELFDQNLLATVAVFTITRTDVAQEDLVLDPGRSSGCGNVGAWRVSGEQKSEGAELELVGKLTDRWRLIASYSYIDANITKDNNVSLLNNGTPNVPLNSAKLYTTYLFGDGMLRGLSLGLGAVYRGERPSDPSPTSRLSNGLTRNPANPAIPLLVNGNPVTQFVTVTNPMLPSDIIANFSATYQATENLSYGLNVDNLFNEKGYESAFSTALTGIKPLRPTTVYGFIQLRL